MDPQKVTLHCRESDIKRVAITCSCGLRSVAEIPKQTARAANAHPCPGCMKIHLFQYLNGKWMHSTVSFGMDEAVIKKESN